MGAASSLRFRPGRPIHAVVWILIVGLLAGLVLLAFIVLLGVNSPDPWPASEPLMGPFRWASPPPDGVT